MSVLHWLALRALMTPQPRAMEPDATRDDAPVAIDATDDGVDAEGEA